MRRKIISQTLPFLVLLLGCETFANALNQERENLNTSNGLIGDDFGVLRSEDIAINDCQAEPVPFSNDSTAYQYWQCFEISKSKLYCDGDKFDEAEKTRVTIMVISGEKEGQLHEYISGRPIPLSTCRAYSDDWRRLLRGEKYLCVSGSFIDRDKNESLRETTHWIFDRFKTRQGCKSYFLGGCSLKYQQRHDCITQAAK
jgi:hypothetical protein